MMHSDRQWWSCRALNVVVWRERERKRERERVTKSGPRVISVRKQSWEIEGRKQAVPEGLLCLSKTKIRCSCVFCSCSSCYVEGKLVWIIYFMALIFFFSVAYSCSGMWDIFVIKPGDIVFFFFLSLRLLFFHIRCRSIWEVKMTSHLSDFLVNSYTQHYVLNHPSLKLYTKPNQTKPNQT